MDPDRIDPYVRLSWELVIAMLWSLIAQVVKMILDGLSLHLMTDRDNDWMYNPIPVENLPIPVESAESNR